MEILCIGILLEVLVEFLLFYAPGFLHTNKKVNGITFLWKEDKI